MHVLLEQYAIYDSRKAILNYEISTDFKQEIAFEDVRNISQAYLIFQLLLIKPF